MMVNKNKAKGTAAETKVVKYLQAHGIPAQRRALAGNKDVGDIEYEMMDTFFKGTKAIMEVKSGIQTVGYSRGIKEEWLAQTRAEAKNSRMLGHLVVVIHNKSIQNAEVWSADGGFFWYLDDFVKIIGGKLE